MNDFTIERSDDLKYINNTLSQLLARKALLEKEYEELKSDVSLAMVRVSWQPEVKEFLDYLQMQEHENSVGAYERLLTAFMEEVLPGYRKVVFDLTIERNAPALNIFIKKGENMPPEDALMGTGGSVTNILVTGLRIISLLRSGQRKFLVLDEPDCWLNPEHIPTFCKVIDEMARELGIQIFMISHYVTTEFNGIDHKVLLYKQGDKLDTTIIGEVPQWEEGDEGIRSIKLTDFQSHANTYIPLSPGVTLFMGDNDIGKSAVVTALRSVFYGEGNKTYIQHFKDKATVQIEFSDRRMLYWERNNKGKYKETYIMLDENHGIDNPLHRNDGASKPDWLFEETGIGMIDDLDIQLSWQKKPLSILDSSASVRAKALAIGSEGDYVQGMMILSKEELAESKTVIKQGEKKLESWRVQLNYLKNIGLLKGEYDAIEKRIQESANVGKKLDKMRHTIDEIKRLTRQKENYDPLLDIADHDFSDQINKINPKDVADMSALLRSWRHNHVRNKALEIIEKAPQISKIEQPLSPSMKAFISGWKRFDRQAKALSPLLGLDMEISIPKENSMAKLVELAARWKALSQKEQSYKPLESLPEIEVPTVKGVSVAEDLLSNWKNTFERIALIEKDITEISERSDAINEKIKDEFPVCPTCERPWGNHEENANHTASDVHEEAKPEPEVDVKPETKVSSGSTIRRRTI